MIQYTHLQGNLWSGMAMLVTNTGMGCFGGPTYFKGGGFNVVAG